MSRFVLTLVLVFVCALTVVNTTASADSNIYYYGCKCVAGKMYYVYLQDSNGIAELWFRVRKDACSVADVKVLVLKPKKQAIDPRKTLTEAARALCTVKRVYDNGRTVLGCASTAASGVCLAASVPSGGTAAAVCSVSLVYTINRGFADCAKGIVDWMGGKLAGDRDWSIIATQASIATGQWSEAIDYAIDYACSGL